MRSTRHLPRCPITYEPSIVIIGQGRKTGHLGGRKIVYDARHYLVMALPLPFECETEGTPLEPLLGVSIGITPSLVAELLMKMKRSAGEARPYAMQAGALDAPLTDATERLLECLGNDEDARILGAQTVREIVYRVLCGKIGASLRALAAPHSHIGQISPTIHRMHDDYASPLNVPALAREAGMSVSTFHAHFKAVTASSPLQYLKNVRLQKARMLMVNEGANAATAALRVGYESASQFSREFKRLFGEGPATEAARLRRALTPVS
jgi:AraC-like DNA-binding protein